MFINVCIQFNGVTFTTQALHFHSILPAAPTFFTHSHRFYFILVSVQTVHLLLISAISFDLQLYLFPARGAERRRRRRYETLSLN